MTFRAEKFKAQNWIKFDFYVKFDFESQGQSHPKTIWTLTKVLCTFHPHLEIVAWMGHKSSCGQVHDWRTDGETDPHTDSGTHKRRQRQYPKVKTGLA